MAMQEIGADDMNKDLISILDVKDDIDTLLNLALDIKKKTKSGEPHVPLKGKSLGMIFEKPSTRTRVSFEVGMTQLGGHALYLGRDDLQMGRGETITDTAKVLSRFLDIIMYRAFSHDMMKELASNATIPVINALDDMEHPCQILADLLTILEHKMKLEGLKLAYIGDGNNVCHSLLLGGAVTGMQVTVATPAGYAPGEEYVTKAKGLAPGRIVVTRDPVAAAMDADVIYTDTWISMGDEAEKAKRLRAFQGFQVNQELLSHAKQDCIVMHCLPAHRNEEITDEVMDGPNSVVFDQAENRLHAQKAVMVRLLL